MKILRLISGMSAFVVAVALSSAFSPPARAQAFNPESWGNDNCLYTWRNGAWGPSGLCRTFPNPDNPKVWDLINAQRTPLYRFLGVDASGVLVVYGFESKMTFKVANRNSVADVIQQIIQQMQMILVQRAQPRAEPVIPDCLRGVDPDVIRADHLTPGSPECMTAKEKAYLNNGPLTQAIVGQANAARENAAADRQSEARQEVERIRSECVSNHERGIGDSRCANGAVR